jgi:hypothetical protein
MAEGRRGFAARDYAEGAAGADLLYDAGEDGAAYVFDFYESERAIAF